MKKINTPTQLKDNDPWMLAEDIPDSDIFFFQIPMSCFASDSSYPFIKNYKKVLTHYKKFHMDFYFGERDSFEVAESVLTALLQRPKFGNDLNKNIIAWSYKLIGFAKKTSKVKLQSCSKKELWNLYKEHDSIHTKLYSYGWLPVAVDMFHNNFTKKLKSYLYKICDSKEQAEQSFIVFTTPTAKTLVAKEREGFLKIYDGYFKKTRKISPKLITELTKHANAWGHLGYIYAGNVEPFGVDHYVKEMRDLAAANVTGSELLDREYRQLQKTKKEQQKLYQKLKVSPQFRNLFKIAQEFALTKLVRRHAQLLDLYIMHTTLLVEIAKRLKLTRFQVQFMLMEDVKNALMYNKYDKAALIERLKECILYTEKNFEAVFLGRQMESLKKNFKKPKVSNIHEVLGQTAQPGIAKGKVKIVIRAKDMAKMNKGDILVSIATDPDIVPAMKKAGAIVTEQGGITSHAAIVSRELGIPCVIGTKIATKVFKDGDMVEVDANKGVVRKI